MKIYPQSTVVWITVENPWKYALSAGKAVDNRVESVDLSTFFCIVYTQGKKCVCTKNRSFSYNILRKVTIIACLATLHLLY